MRAFLVKSLPPYEVALLMREYDSPTTGIESPTTVIDGDGRMLSFRKLTTRQGRTPVRKGQLPRGNGQSRVMTGTTER